jgi:hypothetical protein
MTAAAYKVKKMHLKAEVVKKPESAGAAGGSK